MGDGGCTTDPSCGPEFVFPHGHKEATKLRNNLQNISRILGNGRGALWLGSVHKLVSLYVVSLRCDQG